MLQQLLAPSIYIVLAFAFAAIWYRNRDIDAAGIWAVGYFTSGIGFAGEIILSNYPEAVFLRPIIDASYLGGGMLFAIGLTVRFCDRAYLKLFLGIFFGSVIAANWLWLVHDDYSARSEVISYGSALLMLIAAGFIYPRLRTLDERALFYAVVAFAAQFAIVCFASIHLLGEKMDENSFQNSAYIEMLGFTVALTAMIVAILLFVNLGLDVIQRLRHESQTDPLTKLNNRRAFEMHADIAAETGGRYWLVICDIDNFKQVNDLWGHNVGDQILVSFAKLLANLCPEKAHIGRIGGEEFAILLTDSDGKNALGSAEAIRLAFEKYHCADIAEDQGFSASFGIAEMAPGENYHSAFTRADSALYEAKNGGRNCVKMAKTNSVRRDPEPHPNLQKMSPAFG